MRKDKIVVLMLIIVTIGISVSFDNLFADIAKSDENEGNLLQSSIEPMITINSTIVKPAVYIQPRWDDMTVEEKFGEIILNGILYIPNKSKVNDSGVGEFIGAATAKRCDSYSDKEDTINCEVYSLKSISAKCAVAVKYDGYEGYYSYVEDFYIPATLGDLIDDLNLHENLVFNKIYYTDWEVGEKKNGNYVEMEYTLPDYSVLWDLLLSDTSPEYAGDMPPYAVKEMSISIDVKVIGYKNISLAVTDEGYLHTNILNTGKSFFIGKEKAQTFMNYVLMEGQTIG